MIKWPKTKYKNFSIVVITLSLLLETRAKRINSFAGPFDVILRRVQHCSDSAEDNRTSHYYIRDARNRKMQVHMFSGNMTMPFRLDDSMDGKVGIASWGSIGGWKENAFIMKFKKVCTSIRMMMNNQWKLFVASIFGEELPCPLFAGIYRFENMSVDYRRIPIKQFPYGKWRMDGMVVEGADNTDVRGCLRIYADTVPLLD